VSHDASRNRQRRRHNLTIKATSIAKKITLPVTTAVWL
jgi:hypothetical protein